MGSAARRWARGGARAVAVALTALATLFGGAVAHAGVGSRFEPTPDGAWNGGPAAALRPSGVKAQVGDGQSAIVAGWTGSTDLRLNQAVRLAGSVPDNGQNGSVRLDRYVGGTWRTVLTRPISAAGRWSVLIMPPAVPGPVRHRVVWEQRGRAVGSAELPTLRVFRVHTYDVRTRGTISTDVEEFAKIVTQTYGDERGWTRSYQRFERVQGGPGDFTLWLAQDSTVPSFAASCSSQLSCRTGRDVVINETNWRTKTRAFTGDLATYRHMVLNHETGHWLGLGHRGCDRRRAAAPVMMQQSKSLGSCRANAWPLRAEIPAAQR